MKIKEFKPTTIRGRQFDSLDAIAQAIISKEIKLSDIPLVKTITTSKGKSKTITAPLQLKPLPLPTKEEVGDRILRATLTHDGGVISYRFSPKWPYVIVPSEILDLPNHLQKAMVKKALDKMRPLWQEERDINAAEFLSHRQFRVV